MSFFLINWFKIYPTKEYKIGKVLAGTFTKQDIFSNLIQL